jgi:hypothetical protein
MVTGVSTTFHNERFLLLWQAAVGEKQVERFSRVSKFLHGRCETSEFQHGSVSGVSAELEFDKIWPESPLCAKRQDSHYRPKLEGRLHTALHKTARHETCSPRRYESPQSGVGPLRKGGCPSPCTQVCRRP